MPTPEPVEAPVEVKMEEPEEPPAIDEEKTVSEVSSVKQKISAKSSPKPIQAKVTKTIEKKDKKVMPAMKLTMQKHRKSAKTEQKKTESPAASQNEGTSEEEMDINNNIHFNLNVLKFKKQQIMEQLMNTMPNIHTYLLSINREVYSDVESQERNFDKFKDLFNFIIIFDEKQN